MSSITDADERAYRLDRAAEAGKTEILAEVRQEIEHLRAGGHQDQVAWLLPVLARVLIFERQLAEANAACEESLSFFRKTGSARGQAAALNALAIVELRLGHLGVGLELVAVAASLASIASDAAISTRIANTHGSLLIEAGRFEEAILVLEQGLEASLRAPHELAGTRLKVNLGLALARLSIAARDAGQTEQIWGPPAGRSFKLLEAAVEELRAQESHNFLSTVSGYLALAYVASEKAKLALATLDGAEQRIVQEDHAHRIVPFYCIRARAHWQNNELETALDAIEKALSFTIQRSIRVNLDEVYWLKSRIHERRGETQQALDAYKRYHEVDKQLLLDRAERLHTEARHDALTGLANRRRFDEYLSGVLSRATQDNPICLMLIDLDHFKAINDQHSHVAGDAALRWVAMQLRAVCRPTDLSVRLGGDEFAVVMSAPLDIAEQVFFRLRVAVAGSFSDFPSGIGVTLSVGMAEAWVPCPPHELFARADRALYAAKAAGRDCARIDRGAGKLESVE